VEEKKYWPEVRDKLWRGRRLIFVKEERDIFPE
jgi:hypothetical protein